jgi:hypothetical protein
MFERFQNMDRQTRIGLAVAAIVGILLFGVIAGVIRQAGWNEGFLYGLLADGGDGAKAVTPYLTHRYGYGPHGWGGHGFGFIGGIFRFLFFGFLLLMFFKFLGFWRWRMHGGRFGGPHWQHHGPWGQPPYAQPQPEQQGGQAANAPTQPDENKPQNTSWINV